MKTCLNEPENQQEAKIDRRKFIGSSDIAAVLGISPWKTPYQLWEEKTSPEPLPERDSPLLYWGRKMEPLVIDEAIRRDGLELLARNERHYGSDPLARIDYNRGPSHLSCQLDFVYGRGDVMGVGECKYITFGHDHWGESGTQEVPEYYKAQLYYQLALTGYSEGAIYALINSDLRAYRFEYDKEICGALIEKACAFWDNHVLTGIAPPIRTREDAASAVRTFGGWSLAADAAMLNDIEALRHVKAGIAGGKKLADNLEESIIRRVAIAAINDPKSRHAFADNCPHNTQIGGWCHQCSPNSPYPPEARDVSVLDDAGNKLISWNLQKRKAYAVEESEFRVLRLHGKKERMND